MKYYIICRKMLGDTYFNELVEALLNKIIDKFGVEININTFVNILEINISAILMLAICKKYPNKKNIVINELHTSIKYLVTESIETYEKFTYKYIEVILKNGKLDNYTSNL